MSQDFETYFDWVLVGEEKRMLDAAQSGFIKQIRWLYQIKQAIEGASVMRINCFRWN
jgi:hypothetical protein